MDAETVLLSKKKKVTDCSKGIQGLTEWEEVAQYSFEDVDLSKTQCNYTWCCILGGAPGLFSIQTGGFNVINVASHPLLKAGGVCRMWPNWWTPTWTIKLDESNQIQAPVGSNQWGLWHTEKWGKVRSTLLCACKLGEEALTSSIKQKWMLLLTSFGSYSNIFYLHFC